MSSSAASVEQEALQAELKTGLSPKDGVRAQRHLADGAVDEMLRGTHASALHWDRVPELLVLTPVLRYEKGSRTQYRATDQQLTDDEMNSLVADLTEALVQLSDNVFQGFAAIHRETAGPGDLVNVMRPGQIVVARYSGVRDQLATIGFGGRSTRDDIIRAGSIILDSDFDRTNDNRRLLRTHELGHALGYSHVQSRQSIMNPQVGSGVTDADREVVRIAFRGVAPETACTVPVG